MTSLSFHEEKYIVQIMKRAYIFIDYYDVSECLFQSELFKSFRLNKVLGILHSNFENTNYTKLISLKNSQGAKISKTSKFSPHKTTSIPFSTRAVFSHVIIMLIFNIQRLILTCRWLIKPSRELNTMESKENTNL